MTNLETLVFIVRRFGSISDSWSAHPGKTFDEVVQIASDKIRDGASTLAYDVVEVSIARQATVSARIEAIDVRAGESA